MHAIINGNVQGVGFRATTCFYAQSLGLKGTVRNLSDGKVEIIAQGSRKNLESLLEQLTKKPGHGHVKDVHVEYKVVENTYQDFTIVA